MSEWHAWQRGLQRPLVRCKLLLVRSIHFGGDFSFPPSLHREEHISVEHRVSISSPPSSFRSLLCQPFVLSWWLHPLDAVRGGLGRERLDAPSRKHPTQLAKHSAPFMVRCTQRAVTHLPTRSQCFRFTVGVQYVLFLSENPHNFFYFSPCPLAVSYHQSPFRVSPWTPLPTTCAYFLFYLSRRRSDKRRNAQAAGCGGVFWLARTLEM